jgi:hypothetical protein
MGGTTVTQIERVFATGGDMRIRELPNEWHKQAGEQRTAREYRLRLPVHVAAGVHALQEMYPGRTDSEIVVDLLSAALEELEEAFPYIQGTRVIAEDEFGDPVYEDIGPTPRFSELTRKYVELLQAEIRKP